MLGILNIAILSVALGIGIGFLTHLIEQRTPERGRYLAFVPFLGFLLLSVLIAYLPASQSNQAWVGLCLSMSMAIWVERIAWLARGGSRAGPLLLDLGRAQQHYQDRELTIGILLMALAALITFRDTGLTIQAIAQSILFLSILAPFLIGKLSKLEIREHGIWHAEGLIKWEWIESYQWEGEGANTLTAWVRRPSFIRAWSWSIPPFRKETLNSLLTQYLPASDKGR